MVKETETDKRLAAEISNLKQKEEEKKFLYDKSIGGPNVPRPSDRYIEASIGPLKNDEQIRREAENAIQKQNIAAKQEAVRQAAVNRSMRESDEQRRRHEEQEENAQANLIDKAKDWLAQRQAEREQQMSVVEEQSLAQDQDQQDRRKQAEAFLETQRAKRQQTEQERDAGNDEGMSR